MLITVPEPPVNVLHTDKNFTSWWIFNTTGTQAGTQAGTQTGTQAGTQAGQTFKVSAGQTFKV